jgi:hypothetical protein
VQEAFETLWTSHLWVCAAASADIPACVPDAAIMQTISIRIIFFALFIWFLPRLSSGSVPLLHIPFRALRHVGWFRPYSGACPFHSPAPFLYEKTAPALAGTVSLPVLYDKEPDIP